MFHENELRAEMVRSGVTVGKLVEALNINQSTFYRKMTKEGDFTRAEIGKIIELLGLDNETVERIFFAP